VNVFKWIESSTIEFHLKLVVVNDP